jgi:quercetin dioxygenase-like cupin family protein
MRNKLRTFAFAACATLGFIAGAFAEDIERMIVVPHEQARFVPVDPARPDGAKVAVLWGDPATGPSSMLLKFARTGGRLHVHTSDYHLVLLEGTMRHWSQGDNATDTPSLGPGSYWFQPGQHAHADACETDECVMFIHWIGKRDGWLATEADS